MGVPRGKGDEARREARLAAACRCFASMRFVVAVRAAADRLYRRANNAGGTYRESRASIRLLCVSMIEARAQRRYCAKSPAK